MSHAFYSFIICCWSFFLFFSLVCYLMNVYAMHFAYQNVRAGNNDKISVELMKDESGRHSINAICNEKKCTFHLKKRNDRINCIDLKKNVIIYCTNNRNWNNFMGHRTVLDPKMVKRKSFNWIWSSGWSKQWFADFFFIPEPSINERTFCGTHFSLTNKNALCRDNRKSKHRSIDCKRWWNLSSRFTSSSIALLWQENINWHVCVFHINWVI